MPSVLKSIPASECLAFAQKAHW